MEWQRVVAQTLHTLSFDLERTKRYAGLEARPKRIFVSTHVIFLVTQYP